MPDSKRANLQRTVLWWGRFDPGYSRNRVLRSVLSDLGWHVRDFHPRLSGLGDLEASLRRTPRPDLVWVPCFRQRDLAAASRWATRQGVPLVFDPLISAYDKQVDERGKLSANSRKAQRLLKWERELLARADLMLADTEEHARYFVEVLGARRERVVVVYVGAEQGVFRPAPLRAKPVGTPVEVLFYGSFIPLQGPEVVVEAARLYEGPTIRWTLLGQGPLRQTCEEKARGLKNVAFENWLPYEELPGRIHQADLLLGVFGTTAKAGRVMPNKVFQSLACGRVVITREAGAYPRDLRIAGDSGLLWVPPGDAHALADHVAHLAGSHEKLQRLGEAASETSKRFFSADVVRAQLEKALEAFG